MNEFNMYIIAISSMFEFEDIDWELLHLANGGLAAVGGGVGGDGLGSADFSPSSLTPAEPGIFSARYYSR